MKNYIIKVSSRYYAKRAASPFYALVKNDFNATKFGDKNEAYFEFPFLKRLGFSEEEISIVEFDRYAERTIIPEDHQVPKSIHLTNAKINKLLEELIDNPQKTDDFKVHLLKIATEIYGVNKLDDVTNFGRDMTNYLSCQLGFGKGEEVSESDINRAISFVDGAAKLKLMMASKVIDSLIEIRFELFTDLRNRLFKIMR
ncbi:hypothetical protein LGV96_06055 [Streptococcus mutans]|nr:hypothetical protein [Streptococcus mutans]